FAAASAERKSTRQFLRDRMFRLGLPTLVFMLAIGPATEYFVASSWAKGGFATEWLAFVASGRVLSATAPLWFCAALLGLCVVYAGLRALGWRETRIDLPDGWRGDLAVVAFIGIMAAATFATRVVIREGQAVYNMQLGYFPQYILMFAAGLYAYRGAWL